jgi:hypothetical protein
MKKFLPYILMFTILVGLLSPMVEVRAQTTPPAAVTCTGTDSTTGAPTPAGCVPSNPTSVGQNKSDLENQVPSCTSLVYLDIGSCLVSISYFIFYTIPSALLAISALFFNAVIALALSSVMYSAGFIAKAWTVVRDLSNIFFIIVLLYIAIELILGMGHDAKKMIVQVIIMALLINFSLFFTEIIIDSSNILALIFYNKINVNTTVGVANSGAALGTCVQTSAVGGAIGSYPGDTQQACSDRAKGNFSNVSWTQNNTNGTNVIRPYYGIWSPLQNLVAEKDISGGIFSGFDPTKLMTASFFASIPHNTQRVEPGWLANHVLSYPLASLATATFADTTPRIPNPILLALIVVSGLIIAFAAYTFFIVGLLFIARIAELWILLIFSPFAFMSSAAPFLRKFEGLGWDEWIGRIFQLSFMAPIFMFFVYLIFLLIQIPFLQNLAIPSTQQDTFQVVMLVVLQALLILILLHKATEKAKKTSGELGKLLIKGTEIAMGVVGGLALGGTASLLQSQVGMRAARFAESADLKKGVKEGRFGARALQATSRYLGGAEFDARKGVIGGVLKAAGGVSGINLGHASKFLLKPGGGAYGDMERAEKKRRERFEQLKVGNNEPLQEHLHESEEDLQKMLNKVAKDFEQIDKDLESERQAANDARRGSTEERRAKDNIKDLNNQKKALRTGTVYNGQTTSVDVNGNIVATATHRDGTTYLVQGGANQNATIKDLQTKIIPDQKNAVITENRERGLAEATYLRSGGGIPGLLRSGDNATSRNSAAHKIIMDTKIEDKGGGH